MYRRCEEAWHLRLDEAGRLAPVRLAAMEGERSPQLTGAQRFPAPPLLCKRCDGAGFVRKPAIVECTACEGRGVQ